MYLTEMDHAVDLDNDESLGIRAGFRKLDQKRRKRYAKYFEGDYALENDEWFQHYNPGKRELEMRRRHAEFVMENVELEAMKSRVLFESMGPSVFSEAVNVKANFAAFTTWSLPLIRKIWPKLMGNELVSMQSISQPTGKAFTIDFQYGSSGGAYAAGTSIYTSEDPSYADDPGEGTTPKKIKMVVSGANISVSAKKLLTDWSIEAQQDLQAYHGLSLEPETMSMLAQQILREKNREMVNSIVSNAGSNTTWASTQPSSPNPWANATPKEYQEEIMDAIADANQDIVDNVYRPANRIYCGTTFGTRLEKLSGFRLNTRGLEEGNIGSIDAGPNLYGTLNGRYQVWMDPFFTTDQAILAHKSNDWMYTGFVHLNYVPLWVSPLVPDTGFNFSKGVMSRYANYVKDGNFFSTVTVS